MQLTQHTDLGIRLLIALARSAGAPMALTRFSEDQALSYHHVAKVAQTLVRAGMVVSHRGRNGGVSLAQKPQNMRIGDAVRVLEPNMQMADCPKCKMRADCSAQDTFNDAFAAFMAVLDARTLAQAARLRGTAAAEVQP